MRPRRRATVVDSHETDVLRNAGLRTRLVRVALAAAAVGLLGAAVSSARGLDVRERGLLPSGSTGVVVLDLSLSIADEDYRDVRRAVRRVVAAGSPVGLVIFSDVAYELLPPGTPASELRSLVRLLVPPGLGPSANPWTRTFRSGTRISAALALARGMLAREHVKNGSILLVSDLETAPEDVPPLTRALARLDRESILVRIVPLSPSSDARLLFEGLLGKRAFAAPTEARGDRLRPLRTESQIGLPVGLIVLGGLLLAVLAAHERYWGRLALPRRPRARGYS